MVKDVISNKTHISIYCEAILEIGWLTAFILSPLFLNLYSEAIFEPDKTNILRTIALVMLATWLLKMIHHQTQGMQTHPSNKQHKQAAYWHTSLFKQPFLLPIIIFLVAYILSTLLSVVPSESWFGSQIRGQGTYTQLCVGIIVLFMVLYLRDRSQWERLQSVVIVTSIPVVVYSLLQYIGQDSLGLLFERRIVGTLGNAIFLAAYLNIAFWITGERLYRSIQALRGPSFTYSDVVSNQPCRVHRLLQFIQIALYVLIGSTQLLVIWASQSRGPLLGLGVGIGIAFLLACATLWRQQGRRLILIAIGLTIVSIAGLGVIFNSGTISQNALDTLTSQFIRADNKTVQARFMIWQGAEELFTQIEPLHTIAQEPDAFDQWRPLIGYGPETLGLLFHTVYPPQLFNLVFESKMIDRAHNERWEQLNSIGLLGHVAYLLLYGQIFYWGLHWLSLIRTRNDTILFTVLLATASIVLTFLSALYTNAWYFIGLTLPAGLLLGVGVYLLHAIFRSQKINSEQRSLYAPLIIMLLALFTSHLVETSFGITMITTKLYFWGLLAVLWVAGRCWLGREVEEEIDAKEQSLQGRIVDWVIPLNLIGMTLLFIEVRHTMSFLDWFGLPSNMELEAIQKGIFYLREANQFAFYSWMLVLWILVSAFFFAMQRKPKRSIVQRQIRSKSTQSRSSQPRKSNILGKSILLVSTIILSIGTTLMIQRFHIKPIYADSLFGAAESLQHSEPEISFAFYQQATQNNPTEVQYQVALATWLLQMVDTTANSTPQTDSQETIQFNQENTQPTITTLLSQPLQTVQRLDEATLLSYIDMLVSNITQQNPFEINGYLLKSRALQREAMLAASSQGWQQAEDLFDESLTIATDLTQFSPYLPELWNHQGKVLTTIGRLDEAEQAYRETLTIEPWNWDAHEGIITGFEERGMREEQIQFIRQAIDTDIIARQKFAADTTNDYRVSQRRSREAFLYTTLIYTYYQMNDHQRTMDVAFEFYERQSWNFALLRSLVQLHLDVDDKAQAALWATRALLWAPYVSDEDRIALNRLLVELYSELGDRGRVLNAYTALRTLLPQDVDILEELYQIYDPQRQTTQIAEVLQILMQLEPANYQHPLRFAQLLQNVGQLAEAKKMAQKALTIASGQEQTVVLDFLATLE